MPHAILYHMRLAIPDVPDVCEHDRASLINPNLTNCCQDSCTHERSVMSMSQTCGLTRTTACR